MPDAPSRSGVLRLTVPLDESPDRRWRSLRPHADLCRRLVLACSREFGEATRWGARLESYAQEFLDQRWHQELHDIVAVADVPFDHLLLANLSYDALKTTLACTAFAVESAAGPVHGRNLDWFVADGLLRDATTVFDLVDRHGVRCSLVGWPGCIGAFTGIAPGRFSVSLNAVLSSDPVEPAPPVVLLLRDLLENATYEEAVLVLSTAALPCDCLLMVVGTRPGERCVIERTPRRVAVRRPSRGAPLVVTNEYEALRAEMRSDSHPELLATACARYQRASALLDVAAAPDPFAVLTDPGVRMDITVQHVVMCPATGQLEVRLPD